MTGEEVRYKGVKEMQKIRHLSHLTYNPSLIKLNLLSPIGIESKK